MKIMKNKKQRKNKKKKKENAVKKKSSRDTTHRECKPTINYLNIQQSRNESFSCLFFSYI